MKTRSIGFILGLGLLLIFSSQASAQLSTLSTKVGHDFKIGPFTDLVNKVAEGGKEEGCSKLQSIIAATLQNMQSHMTPRALSLGYSTSWKAFEVNQETLDLFCNKRVTIVLRNQSGDQLMLNKPPFVRTSDSRTGGLGTMIRINAAIIPNGGSVPKQPDEYGQVFMPDRLLPEK